MRKILFVLFFVVCVNICFAQKHKQRNNFIGTWRINTSETVIPGYEIEPTDLITVISYSDSILRITDKINKDGKYILRRERIYYTDGRGETNGKISTKTKWNGSKLVSKPDKKKKKKKKKKKLKRGEKSIGTSSINIDLIITWELSEDGKKLTEIETHKIRTTSSGFVFGGQRKTKTEKKEILRIVYDKQ